MSDKSTENISLNSKPQSDEGDSIGNKFLLIVQETQNYIQFFSEIGADSLDLTQNSVKVINNWGDAKILFKKKDTLDVIENEITGCKRCLISEDRSNIVFGQGPSNARIVFVGNWPDIETDQKGIPFSGPSGDLLSKIIKAMKLEVEDVYLCNILKCRPINSKPPLPEETRTCLPFLYRQLAAIKPEVICTLGTFATQILLNTEESFHSIRGRFHNYNGVKVIPTYHPETLIKDPSYKRATWEDIQKLMTVLGL